MIKSKRWVMARARRLKVRSLKIMSCVGSSGEGRQENSLRTVCSISQVLYTVKVQYLKVQLALKV